MDKIINGKFIALQILKDLKEKISTLKTKPGLAVIIVGDNPASKIYVKHKIKTCTEIGILSKEIKCDINITQEKLLEIIHDLNTNNEIHGILVQLPLPNHINETIITQSIIPKKDVDGFNYINTGKLSANNIKNAIIPCTPHGIMKLLEYSNIDIAGKNAVIIGRSNIVGKPIASLLLNKNATVTITHSKTKNLEFYTQNADIIVAAVGIPNFLKGNMIKKDSIIIDVGINRLGNGKLVGDVDFDSVIDKVSKITPVPKGVGPTTIAMLMYNTLLAYEHV